MYSIFLSPAVTILRLLFSLIGLAVFLLNGYAFYKISKLRFLPYPWMTFIPFLSLYMQGLIADSLKYRHYTINSYLGNIPLAYALPLVSILNNVIARLPLIGGVASLVVVLALWAAQVLVYYLIFSQYAEENQVVLFTVLSIIPVVGPALILYSVRDRRA